MRLIRTDFVLRYRIGDPRKTQARKEDKVDLNWVHPSFFPVPLNPWFSCSSLLTLSRQNDLTTEAEERKE